MRQEDGMNCEICGKRPATIRYAEMLEGQLSTWNLCEECAREKGVTGSLSSFATPLVNVLMGLLGEPAEREAEAPAAACPRCGMSYQDFRRTGRLGCAACYDTFSAELRPLLRRVHGSTRHSGRIPSRHAYNAHAMNEITRLKADLARAVRAEEYERAAEIRDAIERAEAAAACAEVGDVDV